MNIQNGTEKENNCAWKESFKIFKFLVVVVII